MENWGLFVTKAELNHSIEAVKQEGFRVFEVRKLTFIETLFYVGADIRLLIGTPHVVMFEATEEAYKNFCRKHNLISIF